MDTATARADGARAGGLLVACLAEHGTAAHPYASAPELLNGPESPRNLADFLHFLCMLHGRHPGVVDHAARRTAEPEARHWLAAATESFAAERAFLARVAVAAGPVPSTPGSGDSESVVLAQRHALGMLASSERNGCAIGAAFAFVLDWAAIRPALDSAAARFGVAPSAFTWPGRAETTALADTLAASPFVQRAMLFGAQQVLIQHHGLWDLLESRRLARSTAPA